MIVKKIGDVELKPVEMDGARDVSVRGVFGPADGAPTFAMRIFELAPGGHTPFHEHPFEHEILILEGPVALMSTEGPKTLSSGDTALIMPGEKHQFKSLSSRHHTRFMCLVPAQYQK